MQSKEPHNLHFSQLLEGKRIQEYGINIPYDTYGMGEKYTNDHSWKMRRKDCMEKLDTDERVMLKCSLRV